MLPRRTVLALPAATALAAAGDFELCLHQTTLLGAGYRRSLEGAAKAGLRLVEVIPAHLEEFVRREGMPAARGLLSGLGLRAVSSGGVRGLFEPSPARAKALEDLKRVAGLAAELGVDRLVCPCGASGKYTLDDYGRAAENAREAGDVAKQSGVIVMLEFMRGSALIGTLSSALELCRQAGHRNVRPMFDFYHFWAGLSKFEDLDLIREGEIAHVHFQDVPRMPRELLDNSTRDIPGDGVAPLAAILGKLRAKGYRGALSVELFYSRLQQGDPAEVCREIRRKAEVFL